GDVVNGVGGGDGAFLHAVGACQLGVGELPISVQVLTAKATGALAVRRPVVGDAVDPRTAARAIHRLDRPPVHQLPVHGHYDVLLPIWRRANGILLGLTRRLTVLAAYSAAELVNQTQACF